MINIRKGRYPNNYFPVTYHDGKAYQVVASHDIGKIKNINKYKEYLGCDHILYSNTNRIFFCKIIEDIC